MPRPPATSSRPAGTYRARIIETAIGGRVTAERLRALPRSSRGRSKTGPRTDGWSGSASTWAENMNNNDKVISIANSQFAAIRQATGKIIVNDSDETCRYRATSTSR